MPVCVAQNLQTHTRAGSADRRTQGSCLAGSWLEVWPRPVFKIPNVKARSSDDARWHRVVPFVCRPTTLHKDISCRVVSSRRSPKPAKRTPMPDGKIQKWVRHLSKLTAAHALRVQRVLPIADHVSARQPGVTALKSDRLQSTTDADRVRFEIAHANRTQIAMRVLCHRAR